MMAVILTSWLVFISIFSSVRCDCMRKLNVQTVKIPKGLPWHVIEPMVSFINYFHVCVFV